MKRLLLLFAIVVFFPQVAHSQIAVRYISQVITSSGRPLAGATIAICTQQANVSTQPCSPLATIYTDSSRLVHATNPVHSDGLGNYEFYADPETYTLQIYGPGINQEIFVDAPVPCIPNALCPGGLTGPSIQTNEVPNTLQSLLDHQNGNETPAGKQISWSNPSGGIEHAFLTNVTPSTGGSAFIGDIVNLQQNQVICSDSPVHLTNCTPAILVNEQTGVSYAILAADREKVIRQINSSASAYTIPQAGTTGFEAGFSVGIVNNGAGTLTLTPTTSTITYGSTVGASSMPLTQGQAAYLYDDGTNYTAVIIGAGSGTAEKTCMLQFGSDGSASALATTDYFPQMSGCFVKAAGTVDTVIVMADAGASTVRVGFDVNGSYTQISPTLTPATVSGIADKVACANTGGTAITIKGTSVTCSVLSSTSIAAGQYFETSAGTADGTTKRLSIAVTWQ